jgi:uncharacterized protein YndB with AHSA1/START domain
VGVVEVSMEVPAARERVYAVLADGWTYASWVVGAAHIRKVDQAWPAKGARIHHSVGPWPLLVRDETVVEDVEQPRLLQFEAKLWPFGSARVRLTLDEIGQETTRVTMAESVIRGPGKFLPEAAQAVLLAPRNRECLRRLADLAVGNARGTVA